MNSTDLRKVVAGLTICLLAPEAAKAHRAGASGAYEQAFVEDNPRPARRKKRKRPSPEVASTQAAKQPVQQEPAHPPALNPAPSQSAAMPASTGQSQNQAQTQDRASDAAPPALPSTIKSDADLPKPAAIDPSLPTGYSQVILPGLLDSVDTFGIQNAANTQRVVAAKPKPLPFDIFGIFAFIISVFNPGPSWSELEQSGLDSFGQADYATAAEWFEKAAKKDGSSIDSKHLLGLSLARQGQYEKAIVAYDSALSIKPDDQNILLDRAYANYQAGKFTAAASDYSKLAKLNESNYEYGLGQVLSYFGADDRTNLNTALATLRSKFTSEVKALNLSGAISQRLKAPAEALEYYRSANEQDPKSVDAVTGLARAYYSIGDYKAAKEVIGKSYLKSLLSPEEEANKFYLNYLSGDYADAMSSFILLEQNTPGIKLAQGNLGVCRFRAMTDALSKIQSGHRDASSYATLAKGYHSMAKDDCAIYCAQKALALTPNDSHVLCIYGACLEMIGDMANAELYLTRAIKLDPKCETAYITRADVRMQSNRDNEALEDLLESKKLAPNAVNSYTNLGVMYNRLKRYEDAENALNKAATINPNSCRIIYIKGDTRRDQGQFVEAEILYKKANAIAPQDYTIQLKLGKLYRLTGKPDLALQCFNKAAELAPTEYATAISLGDFHFWLRDYGIAGQAYDKALQLKPRDLKANIRRGIVYLRTGQKQEAAKYFAIARSTCKDPTEFDLEISESYKDAGYMQDAIKIVNKAVAAAPQNARSYRQRATLLALTSDYEAALQDWEKAISLEPKNISYRKEKARLLADIGRDREAEETYTSSIDKLGTAKTYLSRANYYFNRREFDKALGDFEGALKLDPKMNSAIKNKAQLLCTTGRAKEGLEFFGDKRPAPDAKTSKEEIADYYENLATLYRIQSNYTKALEYLDIATNNGAGEKCNFSYQCKAYIYIALGKWQAALKELDRHIALEGWDMRDPGFGMGILPWLCYTKLGDNKSASAAIENTLQKIDAGWPKPILEYLAGKISKADLLKLASTTGDKTEAMCWIGVQNMLQGKNVEARENFQWTTTNGTPSYLEQIIAKSYLAQLK